MGAVESSHEGIRVQKAFDAEHLAVPVVVFRLESHRRESVTVTVSDYLPKAVAADSVEFHPAFDGEHWRTTTTRSVEYERRLDPGETVFTLYAADVPAETAPANIHGPAILSAVRARETTRRSRRRATSRRKESTSETGRVADQRGSSEERGAVNGHRTATGNGRGFGSNGLRTGRYGNRLSWSAGGVGDADALGTGDVRSRGGTTETDEREPFRSRPGGRTGDNWTVRSLPVVGVVAAAFTVLLGLLQTHLVE